jgi:hypothetical protein
VLLLNTLRVVMIPVENRYPPRLVEFATRTKPAGMQLDPDVGAGWVIIGVVVVDRSVAGSGVVVRTDAGVD